GGAVSRARRAESPPAVHHANKPTDFRAAQPHRTTARTESLDSINKAYEIIVPKVCHARFGSVFRQWKAENVIKHENVALRTKLKAGADKKRKSVESATVTPGLATAKKARNEEAESDVAEANVNIDNMTC
ncbi:hypothetical protein THAOC_21804, partial [Thalassiosira oceanica]